MTSAHDINSVIAMHRNQIEAFRLSSISSLSLRHNVLLEYVVTDQIYLSKQVLIIEQVKIWIPCKLFAIFFLVNS